MLGRLSPIHLWGLCTHLLIPLGHISKYLMAYPTLLCYRKYHVRYHFMKRFIAYIRVPNTAHFIARHIIRFNSYQDGADSNKKCANYYADIANIVFQNAEFGHPKEDVYATSRKFADLFENLAADLTIPLTLREVGIKSSDIELLATEAMKQTRLLPNNARNVCYDDAICLYKEAF